MRAGNDIPRKAHRDERVAERAVVNIDGTNAAIVFQLVGLEREKDGRSVAAASLWIY